MSYYPFVTVTVVSNSLRSRGLLHTRLPCPSLSPGLCSNSYPLSWWHHPTSVIPFPPAFNLPQLRVFSSESALHIRWPKCWNFSFSISPSNEYSESISFRIDWFDLLIYDYPFSLCNICAAVTSLIPNFCLWLSLSLILLLSLFSRTRGVSILMLFEKILFSLFFSIDFGFLLYWFSLINLWFPFFYFVLI